MKFFFNNNFWLPNKINCEDREFTHTAVTHDWVHGCINGFSGPVRLAEYVSMYYTVGGFIMI